MTDLAIPVGRDIRRNGKSICSIEKEGETSCTVSKKRHIKVMHR